MARRSARPKMRPSLESLENRTLLTTIGVVVKGNSPYAGDATWVDVRHLFLPWGEFSGEKFSPDPSLPLTSTGYPEATAGTYANIANYPDGSYQVSYQGSATLSFTGVGQLTTPATLGSDGLYHAVLTVNLSWNTNHLLTMQATGMNSSNPFGNLHIIMPGYGTNPTQEFTNSFLQDLQPFSYIRMVEWNNTINSTQVNWSDRVTPNDFTACGPDGTSYEDIVALANESNKDLWINVPALATNAYITSLAQLIDQDLNPNLRVYVEYSNETWNNSWEEYNQVLAAADSNPLVTDQSNPEAAVGQQTAFQTRNIGDIFKQVFGSQASRVLPVLGGWAAVPSYNQVELQFLLNNYGTVSNSIADFAIAPYVVLSSGTDVAGMSMAALFNSMENYLNTDVSSWLTGNEALSKTFGVPVISYEGGQGLYPSSSKNPALQLQAQNNPGMYTLYKNLIAMWEQDIGTPFTFYALNDSYWGLLPSVTATGSEKWDAVISSILPAGDANLAANGQVTSADIAIIEAHMGDPNAWWEDGDFTHSGVVNAQDLALAEAGLPAIPAAATFVSDDTSTQGNWEGVYGSDGYDIIGNQSNYPVYASVTTTNATTCVWNNWTTDARALQDANSTGAHNRTAGCWFSTSGSFTVNINLADGNTHVVTIYADDWDNQGRSEQVQVIDPSTGNILDTRTISSFSGGVYLSWQLTGNVELRFTGLSGPNPVLNGIFFDHVDSSTFLGADRTTQGNWEGEYGSDGYDIIGYQSSLPSYAQVTTTNATAYVWNGSTPDVRALDDPGATVRIAGALYNPWGQFSINVDLTDGNSHVVTLYADDWDSQGRSERIDVINVSTGTVLDSRTISNFSGGVYLSWNLSGNIEFLVTGTSPNPVISGIFFGRVNSASFVSTDTTTQGNWQGVYGSDGYDVIANQDSLPSYAQVTTTNTATALWNNSTSDVRALQDANATGATDRLAACWFNPSGPFAININLTDGQTHVVTIYADDWDNQGRSERVDVINPSTGTVLDSRTISSFSGGVYLSWDLKGSVELLVTPLTGPNAVISGIFFDHFNSATFVSSDTTTQGNWQGVYGNAGYHLVGNQVSLPSYAEVAATNASGVIWNGSTTDVRALQDPNATAANDRTAACWYAQSGQVAVDVNLTDGQTHVVSIYALDWDNKGRTERVDVIDPSTGRVLDSRTISSFNGGIYLTWKLRGNVQLRFTDLSGPNPVVSGIFFNS